MWWCGLFFCKQKTSYELRISDWSSDVCSSDLGQAGQAGGGQEFCRQADPPPPRRRWGVAQAESGRLVLQGTQFGRAWSAIIGQDSGTMVLAVAGDGVAFAVFGACTAM